MWKGTGRSGYGEQTILGDYDDWHGLSMNGRQWKNRETKETRDLSGSDYWHQRKAIEPKMPEDVPTFVNDRPNISAFAEPVRKVKPKKSVADSIDLAQKHFDKLEQMSIDLDNEYFDGEIDQTRYDLLRYKLDERLIKAWNRLEKDSLKAWQAEDARWERLQKNKSANKKVTETQGFITNTVFDVLSEENLFKKLFMSYWRIKEKFKKHVYN